MELVRVREKVLTKESTEDKEAYVKTLKKMTDEMNELKTRLAETQSEFETQTLEENIKIIAQLSSEREYFLNNPRIVISTDSQTEEQANPGQTHPIEDLTISIDARSPTRPPPLRIP